MEDHNDSLMLEAALRVFTAMTVGGKTRLDDVILVHEVTKNFDLTAASREIVLRCLGQDQRTRAVATDLAVAYP